LRRPSVARRTFKESGEQMLCNVAGGLSRWESSVWKRSTVKHADGVIIPSGRRGGRPCADSWRGANAIRPQANSTRGGDGYCHSIPVITGFLSLISIASSRCRQTQGSHRRGVPIAAGDKLHRHLRRYRHSALSTVSAETRPRRVQSRRPQLRQHSPAPCCRARPRGGLVAPAAGRIHKPRAPPDRESRAP
jgi:hypothetical protein